MKTFSRIMAVTALVGMAGCGKLPGASLGGTFLAEPFLGLGIQTEGLGSPANTYTAALGREYQSLARINATEYVNWIDASAFTRKGLAAVGGQRVEPWAPSALGLSGEVDSLYQTVKQTVNANYTRNPVACARTSALYDRYLEVLSEGDFSCADAGAVRAELDDALEACGYRVVVPVPVPVPAPVYVEPEPVYVEPAPVYVEPEPVPYVEPEPVYVEPEPYNACAAVSVPNGCSCNADGNNYPVITCERVVEKEVIREIEVPVPAPYVAPVQPYVPPTPEPTYAPDYPLNYTIYFGYDRYDLTAEARQVIDEAVQAFMAYAAPFMDIIGHTDSKGSKAYNQRLAERRANAVADSVASQGVNRGSLRVSARSELDPAVSSGDGVREALNRRVTISIIR